jgi:hypothetical protein
MLLWCVVSLTLPTSSRSYLSNVRGQPGVADPTLERLVEEKVETFWKGLENVALKRGQVRQRRVHLVETIHTNTNYPRSASHFQKRTKGRLGLGSQHMRRVTRP